MGLTLQTEPQIYPVSLSEAKEQLRVDYSDEDGRLGGMIAAATAWAQEWTGRTFMAATWVHTRAGFADWMELPRGPVSAVTSVTYIDSVLYLSDPGGTTVRTSSGYYKVLTLDAAEYYTSLDGPIGAVGLNIDGSWPSTLSRADAVRVAFTSGYSTQAEVPAPVREAILLLVTYLFENRGAQSAEMPVAVRALLQPYKIYHGAQA